MGWFRRRCRAGICRTGNCHAAVEEFDEVGEEVGFGGFEDHGDLAQERAFGVDGFGGGEDALFAARHSRHRDPRRILKPAGAVIVRRLQLEQDPLCRKYGQLLRSRLGLRNKFCYLVGRPIGHKTKS